MKQSPSPKLPNFTMCQAKAWEMKGVQLIWDFRLKSTIPFLIVFELQ